MSPDIEWHVGDEADKETIAKTPPPRSSSHRRKVLIGLMVSVAIGLGIVYSFIPEPAPHPTPTPLPPMATPQAIPAKLYETIDREAQALAGGDFKTFSSLQDQSDGPWFQAQNRAFQAWGSPLTNVGSLYTVFESGTLSSDQAWADVRQFRNGQYFRETRFYRQVNGQWLRTEPELSFWSGQQQSLQTQHFDVSYAVEDSDFIQMVAQRFEAAYNQVCADLDCARDLAPIQLALSPSAEHPDWSGSDHTIVLPSPRISGMYVTVNDETAHRLDDPVTQAAYQSLVLILVQVESGGFPWTSSHPPHAGAFFVAGIMYWEYNRVSSHPDASTLLPPPELITNTQLVRLESLWDEQMTPSNPEQVAASVSLFIEQKFGAPSVGKFLRAIGPARSFKQAIETGLGIDEAAFEQQWKDWLRQLPPAVTPPFRPPTPIATLNSEGLLLFVCTQARALCLMHPDGTDLQQVTTGGQYFWPRWSPDGRVFTALHLREGPRGGIGDGGEVVSFSAEGTRLIAHSFGDMDRLVWANPTWSPNGQWLALTLAHDRNGDGLADPGERLETLIFDRTTLQPAFAPLQGGAFDWPPAWSADSRRLALMRVTSPGTSEQDETREIWMFDTQTKRSALISRGNDPAWLPRSNRLTFVNTDRTELKVLDVVAGQQQTLLTDKNLRAFLQQDDPWLPTGKLSFRWPSGSPDGSTLAFRVWGQSDEPWPKYFPGMLFTIDVNGKSLRRWPDTDTPNTAIQVWSPNGDRLAYTYWIVGDGRYYLNPGTPTPQRRFTYNDCCSGLILVDLRHGSYRDEPGPHSIDLQSVGAWSPDDKWFATVKASGPIVISAEHPEPRRVFPNVDEIAEVQWQPIPK